MEKGVNSMEITLSELLQSNLIKPSTKDSIIKVGKMRDTVKKSVIAQLGHRFETVEYVAGKRGQEPRFILGKSKEVESEYIPNVGRPSIDWSDEIKLFKSAIYKNGSKPITKKTLIYLAFGLEKSDRVRLKCFRKVYFKSLDLESISALDLLGDSNKQTEIYIYQIQNIAEFFEEYVLKYKIHQMMNTFDTILNETSYIITYRDNNKEILTGEEYAEYASFRNEIIKQLKENDTPFYAFNGKIKKAIKDKFGFEFAYEEYTFTNSEQFAGVVADVEKCKKDLFNRIMRDVQKRQERFNVKNVKKEILSTKIVDVLMSFDELSVFIEKFLNLWFENDSVTIIESEAEFLSAVKIQIDEMEIAKSINVSNGRNVDKLMKKLQSFKKVGAL